MGALLPSLHQSIPLQRDVLVGPITVISFLQAFWQQKHLSGQTTGGVMMQMALIIVTVNIYSNALIYNLSLAD